MAATIRSPYPANSGRSLFLGIVMPTRRTFELIVVTVLAMRPAMSLFHVWAAKTLGQQQPGSVAHGVAEIVTVVLS